MGTGPMSSELLREIVGRWFADTRSLSIRPVANGDGYSGARLWKVSASDGTYCLRRWPADGPSSIVLDQVHRLLVHLAATHPSLVSEPCCTPAGSRWIEAAGRRWELSPWLPGAARPAHACTPAAVSSAMSVLADLHGTAESLAFEGPRLGRSPGLSQRRRAIEDLLAGGLDGLRQAVASRPANALQQTLSGALGRVHVALRDVAELFRSFGDPPLRQQWRIGDVRREHILFVGDEVSGVVDFNAACVDSVAGDVARLLGSMAGDDPVLRRAGLASYEARRPLTDPERQAVELFDRGGLCVAVTNWARWVAVEQKRLGPDEKVAARIQELANRLVAESHSTRP